MIPTPGNIIANIGKKPDRRNGEMDDLKKQIAGLIEDVRKDKQKQTLQERNREDIERKNRIQREDDLRRLKQEHEDELRKLKRQQNDEANLNTPTDNKLRRRRETFEETQRRDPFEVFDEAIDLFHRYNADQIKSKKKMQKFREEFQQAGQTIDAANQGRDSEGNPTPPWLLYAALGLGGAGTAYGVSKRK